MHTNMLVHVRICTSCSAFSIPHCFPFPPTSGILANPQWKHWRHMEMLKKDQIRLSNGIWRSWHIQCIYILMTLSITKLFLLPLLLIPLSLFMYFSPKRKDSIVCSFVLDPDADSKAHKEPQVLPPFLLPLTSDLLLF